ncbi:MAG: hypothetical protein KIT87_09050 [Anaerolineae bacterium]|nr:hypothetical protein [Anaerolineae bacterium]
MPDRAVCTIVAKPGLPYARALGLSLRQHHPDLPLHVLLLDEVEGRFEPAQEPFSLHTADALPVPHLNRLRFAYAQPDLAEVIKPVWLGYLMAVYGVQRLVWFEPHVQVLGSLDPLFDALDHTSLLLTPRLLGPEMSEPALAAERDCLQGRLFSTGCLGLSSTPTTSALLTWWARRLLTPDGETLPWLDLAPSLFEGVAIARMPGLDVAYWNLHERTIETWNGQAWVNGQPLVSFNFRGFDPYHSWRLSWEAPERRTVDAGAAAPFYWRYLNALSVHSYHNAQGWGYTYDHFDNGVPIAPAIRRVYRELGASADALGDPFQTFVPGSFFRWLNQPVGDVTDPARPVTRLWHALYRQRSDLHAAFPDPLGADRAAFLAWTVEYGAGEMGIAAVFVPSVRRTGVE